MDEEKITAAVAAVLAIRFDVIRTSSDEGNFKELYEMVKSKVYGVAGEVENVLKKKIKSMEKLS